MIVGSKLRKIREQKGISLGFIANYLDMSVSALMAVERDKKHITLKQVDQLCSLLNVNRSDLIIKP